MGDACFRARTSCGPRGGEMSETGWSEDRNYTAPELAKTRRGPPPPPPLLAQKTESLQGARSSRRWKPRLVEQRARTTGAGLRLGAWEPAVTARTRRDRRTRTGINGGLFDSRITHSQRAAGPFSPASTVRRPGLPVRRGSGAERATAAPGGAGSARSGSTRRGQRSHGCSTAYALCPIRALR